jgi:cell division protein FtsW (lipid II flippase)
MRLFKSPLSANHIQSRLFQLAAVFLFIFAAILTLSPATRERSWTAPLHWSQWLGVAIWAVGFYFASTQLRRRFPDSDPYLLPIAGLLSGWGMLTIWRLSPLFGIRQMLWLLFSLGVFIIGLRVSPDLLFMRRYKYLWLTFGLLLTALTLVFGRNPAGGDEHLWLGCCGIYFQPSEPLKLLLIIYLAAYLADRLPLTSRWLPLLAPGAVVTLLAALLLLAQHDLGTMSTLIFLFSIILFFVTGKRRVLWISLTGLVAAVVAGYFLFDVVRIRVDAWLDPWLDPSGRSYQIVQSLLAVANGGTLGRGPGLGSPGLVPVAISDFIYTAIAEETGLVGTIGLLALIGFFIDRGMRIALRAPDNFRRFLAAGLTVYLGAQSILIVGGNLRLLPLTGVTLPFVSYGGSSLFTSFLAILLLSLISSQAEADPAPLMDPRPYSLLTALLGLGLFAIALTNGWWAIWRGPDLLTRTDNARRSIADRYVKRGSLLDRHESPINITQGQSGSYQRVYLYSDLAPIVGYTHPIYGQAGLESSLDPYLRGLQGNPASMIWLDHLLYGEPPPGLDVRLSLDLDLQRKADALLGTHTGSIILLNASSGEILVMASHPSFDPNTLDAQGAQLSQDPRKPLLDRAAQGLYPPGNVLGFFDQAAGLDTSSPQNTRWSTYAAVGFYTSPNLQLPVSAAPRPDRIAALRLSPLQMALAATVFSHDGLRPPPRLAIAVDTPSQGWVVLPALGNAVQALPAEATRNTAEARIVIGQPFWDFDGTGSEAGQIISWYLTGTLPDWKGSPLALVVMLEENDPGLAKTVGQTLIQAAIQP